MTATIKICVWITLDALLTLEKAYYRQSTQHQANGESPFIRTIAHFSSIVWCHRPATCPFAPQKGCASSRGRTVPSVQSFSLIGDSPLHHGSARIQLSPAARLN